LTIFAGDLGQRIFQQPFSWKALGVDVRGRSSNLRINYRTSHQIRSRADRLLGPEVSQVGGNTEQRNATVSLFNGPAPEILVFDSPQDEISAVSKWLKSRWHFVPAFGRRTRGDFLNCVLPLALNQIVLVHKYNWFKYL